jgi:hypothetical protein
VRSSNDDVPVRQTNGLQDWTEVSGVVSVLEARGSSKGGGKAKPLLRLCTGVYARPEGYNHFLVRVDFVFPDPSKRYMVERFSQSRSADASTILFRSGDTDYTLRAVSVDDVDWLLPGAVVGSVEELLGRLNVQLHAEPTASRATVQERGTDR